MQGLEVEAVDLAFWDLIQHRPPDGDVAHPSARLSGPELVTSSAQNGDKDAAKVIRRERWG